jgi:hypothetical protein
MSAAFSGKKIWRTNKISVVRVDRLIIIFHWKNVGGVVGKGGLRWPLFYTSPA